MAFSMLFGKFMGFWALIPKWLIVGVVVVLAAYYIGVGHGRAPYKVAAKIKQVKVQLVAEGQQKAKAREQKLRKMSYENFKGYEFVITDADAGKLRKHAYQQ
uniref:Uncharacterized protein n=1 Tax=OCS116 cluster bacterium TaxID=2030921 RepID=A0A2A4Z8N8_9PROT